MPHTSSALAPEVAVPMASGHFNENEHSRSTPVAVQTAGEADWEHSRRKNRCKKSAVLH